MAELGPKQLPSSSIARAINYSLALWPRLIRYTDDGRLEIDNNIVENSIRPIAIGRKNYLFAGSHQGAKWSAILYTIMATAKAAGLEPKSYLALLLSRIADHPINRLEQLLPQNWNAFQENNKAP